MSDMEKRGSSTARWILLCVLVFLIVFNSTVGFLLTISRRNEGDLGVRCLEVMYNFEDIEDLEENYNKLSFILDESLWEEFTLNNDSRVISAYYKFRNSKTSVDYLFVSNSIIIYRLNNENIEEDRIFAFIYKTNGSRITELREYELTGICRGVEGVF